MKNLHWLIPPLLAVTAFFSARAIHTEHPTKSNVPQVPQAREDRKERDVAGLIADFEQDLAKAEIKRESEVTTMSAAALRERVLELRRKTVAFDSETDWGVVERTEIALRRAARQLGKVATSEALEWIRREAPQLQASVMQGVAEADPDLALREIIASKTGRANSFL